MEFIGLKTRRALIRGCAIALLGIMAGFAWAGDSDPKMTGLPELTREELEWQNKHMLKVKKVKINQLGLERVNKWREKNGKKSLEEGDVTASGKKDRDLDVTLDENVTEDTSLPLPEADDMPGRVDNSELMYFPPIRSQGSLNSCGAFNGVYYAMTHMNAMAADLDAKNGGDLYRLSPKWAYNMINGGENAGVWYYSAYEIGRKHGAATWAEFPYDADYRAWNLNPATWEDALYRRFDQYGYVADTHKDTGIALVKQMLLNGYVLNIPTYINSWVWQTVGNDPSTPDDDAFAGKRAVSWVNGTQGYHAMTVVGYNDAVWVDINGNGSVDSGEKGAFRIANSWGTGWGEAGFAWMAYDALKNPSAVSGGPSTGRIYGWYPARAHWVTARADYEPRLIGRFTLNHLKRDHLRMTLGISDVSQSSPATVWIPGMIYNQGGAYAFNGTTTAVNGTFVLDFSDLVPSGGGVKTYYLGVEDDTVGDPAVLSAASLIDLANGYVEIPLLDEPLTADGNRVFAAADYDFADGNMAPEAVAEASVLSGTIPLSVGFDGSLSRDNDGAIASWQWDFGDGTSTGGEAVSHIYEQAGSFTVTLTVTDGMGATDTDTLLVEALPDPSKRVWVSDMQAALESRGKLNIARVTVFVVDADFNPVAGALVRGAWSGLVSGDVTGTTGSDGSVSLISKQTNKKGVITFTVSDVSFPGHTYDPTMNALSNVSLSTSR